MIPAERATKILATVMEAERNAPKSMTARELLQKLQNLDEQVLDMPVYVRQANGGYDLVRDVSVDHPIAVVHLGG